MMASSKERHKSDVYILAVDLAKRSFQVCATDHDGSFLYNRSMPGAKLEQLLEKQAPAQGAGQHSAVPAPPCACELKRRVSAA